VSIAEQDKVKYKQQWAQTFQAILLKRYLVKEERILDRNNQLAFLMTLMM